jgi:hypothetical protein
MASISNKQMEKQLYALVECLADNYGFDVDEAYEFCSDGTDVNHIQKFMEKPKKAAEKPEKEEKEKPSPLETAQKNIALWTKKADALDEKISSGKSTDEDADQAALDKLHEKLEKERKKLAKLDDEKPAAKPAKKETPKKEVAKKEPAKKEEKEKRIKRMTPLIKGQLKTALEGVKLEFSDKHQKDFVAYVEEMEDDDFRACGLADHMRNYAKSHAEPEEEEEIDNGAGTGLKPAAGHVTLSLKALQAIKMTASVEPPGTYWDADNGRFVKGPEAVDDEDVEEITFEDTEYGVGLKSGRVYLEVDGKDVFQGFSGVGKFKAMKRV